MCQRSDQTLAKNKLPWLSRRRNIWEFDESLLCPMIGTCISIRDLEKILRQAGVVLENQPRDYELHVSIVCFCKQKNRTGKTLQKYVDRLYSRFARQAKGLKDVAQLYEFWHHSKRQGDVPGGLWAVLSHPCASNEFSHDIYTDVHMLSHISDMSHREALGRIPTLETAVKDLESKLEKARVRQAQLLTQRDEMSRTLEMCAVRENRQTDKPQHETVNVEEIEKLRSERKREHKRNNWMEDRLIAREQALDERVNEVIGLRELLQEIRDERDKAESSLSALLNNLSSRSQTSALLPDLNGQQIVYLGGRRSLIPKFRSLVESFAGQFSYHDGGKEDNRAMLEPILKNADLVFCPIECISHDACLRVKRCCQRTGAMFIPLRTPSLTGFTAALCQSSEKPKSNGAASPLAARPPA